MSRTDIGILIATTLSPLLKSPLCFGRDIDCSHASFAHESYRGWEELRVLFGGALGGRDQAPLR